MNGRVECLQSQPNRSELHIFYLLLVYATDTRKLVHTWSYLWEILLGYAFSETKTVVKEIPAGGPPESGVQQGLADCLGPEIWFFRYSQVRSRHAEQTREKTA